MRRAINKLKRLWMRVVLRDVHYADNYEKLNSFYLLSDPWNMELPCEQHRFAETNRLILEKFGYVGSVLEVGCGEGHQSVYLQKICKRLVGLDVSQRAVERARRKCPEGIFKHVDIFAADFDNLGPFDLVVACEVLYYMSDVSTIIKRMGELGRNYLVTYHFGKKETLDPIILALQDTVSSEMEFQEQRWRAVWWGKDCKIGEKWKASLSKTGKLSEKQIR